MNASLRYRCAPEEFAGAGDPGAIEACFAHLTDGASVRPIALKAVRPSLALSAERALIQAYRDRGFLKARLDPLGLARPPEVPDLEASTHGLDPRAAAGLIARLEAAYCGTIGWEFGHIHDAARRHWIEDCAECAEPRGLIETERGHILALLTRATTFDSALAQRLPGAKLFGLGGAESLIVLIEALLAEGVRLGVDEVVVGGMHRGRFNMLANVMGKPLTALLAEIQGKPAVPDGLGVSSDAAYHLGFSGEREIAGRRLMVSVSPHPSHLQLAPVISQGRARAKQARRGDEGRRTVLPLLVHTDASFAGQGLVAEMFQLSRLPPFDIGGSVHVVINNQIGFTTPPEEGRSARHPTDIAKLVEAPVLHVNGDDPEAVYRVARVAANWRAAFASDVVVDLVCYRRPGHNELDEPRFTQPLMYQTIEARPRVHQLYEAELARNNLDTSQAARAAAAVTHEVRAALHAAKSYAVGRADWFEGVWRGFRTGSEAEMVASPETGLPLG